MRLEHILRTVLTRPPTWTAKRAVVKTRNALQSYPRRIRARRSGTYEQAAPGTDESLARYVDPVPTAALLERAEDYRWLADQYLSHRFDLLGSGWTTVEHGLSARGVEGHVYDMGAVVESDPDGAWLTDRINDSNVSEARTRWRRIEGSYTPIDWHRDFKSGYRWAEDIWYEDIEYGHEPGVDVKVPWELSRCQHLSQLAFAYALARADETTVGDGGFERPDRYLTEFQNQIRDFSATNPPQFGVNWNCTMDVAIRAANFAIAADLFRAHGATFERSFDDVLRMTLYEHGRHIVRNLEWHSTLRSNHYLADVVGLLIVAAYLPATDETDGWLALAIGSLVDEVTDQFHTDGSNFEASTCYHRLSAEMVVYGTAVALAVPPERREQLPADPVDKLDTSLPMDGVGVESRPLSGDDRATPFPAWYLERIARMGQFTETLTGPTGEVPQIGDNDSGRFLKLAPACERTTVADVRSRYQHLEEYDELDDDATYLLENYLDHDHLTAAVNGLFGEGSGDVDGDVIGSLSGRHGETPARPSAPVDRQVGSPETLTEHWERGRSRPSDSRRQYEIETAVDADAWTQAAFDEFGAYVFSGPDEHLVLRCGSIGQHGNGGHAHNDQLSLTLWTDGEARIRDPGTYLYTPLPDRRNEYRTADAHFCPRVSDDPQASFSYLFGLDEDPDAECLYFGAEGFVGVHLGHGVPVYRIVRIRDGRIELLDFADGDAALADVRLADDGRWWPHAVPFSPGYGIRES